MGADDDRLAVTGAVTLDGSLNVTHIGGFEPALSDSFTIMTYGSVVGGFDPYGLPVPGDPLLMYQQTLGATALTRDVVAAR